MSAQRGALRLLILVFLAAAASSTAGGQDEGRGVSIPALELGDFRLSEPPALVLLGVSPSSVARPNTPRALIASLVSAAGSSGLVPNGYALETAPFWLSRHPSLELREYYQPSFAARLRYFTAISAATSRPRAKADSIEPDAHVSVALRTLLLNGRPAKSLVASINSVREAQLEYITKYRQWEKLKPQAGVLSTQKRRLARQEELLSTLVTRVMVGPERELRDSTLRTLARRDSARTAVAIAQNASDDLAKLESQMDAIESRLSTAAKSFSKEEATPDGLIVEVAAGTRALFARGRWSDERVDGVGLWITPMYRLSTYRLELVTTGRYLTRVAEYDDRDLIDVGARVGWEVGKATVSGEWANRAVHSKERAAWRRSSRWAALFSYPVSAVHLVASFGSDFQNLEGDRPVIATIGLDLGLGAVMIKPGSSAR